jgi:hypothetical protein
MATIRLSGLSVDNTGMAGRYYDLHGARVVELQADGAPLRNDRDAVDVIAAAAEHHPDVIVIPAERLDEEFFHLRTGIAGQVVQKFLTYGLRIVIVGNLSKRLQESSALRDFVYECNSGSHVWFVASLDELGRRLRPRTNAM